MDCYNKTRLFGSGIMYANVIIQYGNKAVDRDFTYVVPSNMRDKIRVGHRVRVLFNNREIEGFVLGLFDKYEGEYKLNEIISLVDEEPILNEEMLYLGEEICNKTLCSKISAYQVMLPKALKASESTNIGIKKNRYIVLNVTLEEVNDYISKCRYQNQVNILNELIRDGRILVSSRNSSIDTLNKKGIIKYDYEDSFRYNINASGRYKLVTLNSSQQKVVDSVNLSNKDKTNPSISLLLNKTLTLCPIFICSLKQSGTMYVNSLSTALFPY